MSSVDLIVHTQQHRGCYYFSVACRLECPKAKGITPLIAWRREALKEEALDDLP